MNNNSSSVNFCSSTHVYFFTPEGRRICSEKNIRTCERYLIRNLNNAKNLKMRNLPLVDCFKSKDKDFENVPRARSFYERAKSFVSVITGKDVASVDGWAKNIGKSKKASYQRIGTPYSFETYDAINTYNKKTKELTNQTGIYTNGNRQAFGIVFEPIFNKEGSHNGEFKCKRAFWFDENRLG